MFKKNRTLSLAVVLGVLSFFVSVKYSLALTPTIHAVAYGGNWNNPSTWIENVVPGSAYDIIGDNKFAFIPKGHNYKITGQATGLGHFNARIQDVQKGKTVSTAYYNEVPINSLGTNIEIDIANNKPKYEMKVDQTGDKVFRDKIKHSSMLNTKESDDRVKPETKAEVSGQTIKLTASDDNSKVLKTKYSLD